MATNFPKSIFSNQTLCKVAGRFNIPETYFTDNQEKHAFRALNFQEFKNIWREDEHYISADEMTLVVEMYSKMSTFDAYFLATRLPLVVLTEITGMPRHCAAALKRACNYLRDMTPEEYAKRDTSKPVYRYFKYSDEFGKKIQEGHTVTHEKPKIYAGIPYEFADDKDEIIKKLRPYMNEKQFKKMPTTVRLLCVSTPKHILKRIWSGKGFDKCYESIMK